MIKRLTESSVRICCGNAGCPVVEKIDDDHFVDKEGGKVDHTHPVSPSRTSGTDPVEAL